MKITFIIILALLLTTAAAAQDKQIQINIAIIKTSAMIEYNNQQILNLTRIGMRFDDQLKRLQAQSAELQKQKAVEKDKTAPEPEVK